MSFGIVISCILTVIIFLCLYKDYIFGNYYYIFTDYGKDTADAYVPIFYYFINAIKNGNLDFYSFSLGLGSDIFTFLSYILDPFFVLLLFIAKKNIFSGLIYIALLKSLFTSIFAYLYFNQIYKNIFSKIGTTIIWTFSGYMVLWGQHYQFGTIFVYFTLFMYCLQMVLMKNQKYKMLLVISIVLIASSSIYFLYMLGIFSAIYTAFYSYYILRNGFLKTFKNLVNLFGMAAIGIGISAVFTFSWFDIFCSSARSSLMSFSISDFVVPFDHLYFISYFARLFSNDLLGFGDTKLFSGVINYYECAVLSSSILICFALGYLFSQKKYRKIVFIITVMIVYALLFPAVGKILTFAIVQRWTLMITFVLVIAIGIFLDELNEFCNQNIFFTILLIPFTMVFILIWIFQYNEILFEKDLIKLIIMFSFFYSGLFISFRYIPNKWTKVFIILCICIELVAINYPTVNFRERVLKDQWNNGMYFDGTNEAIESISDNSLYRVNKNYYSFMLNDALIQNYYSTNMYSSMFSKNIMTYMKMNGGQLPNNQYTVEASNYISNSLLSVKYLITEDELIDTHYELYCKTGDKLVYLNKYYLSFGYLYYTEISNQLIWNTPDMQRNYLTTMGYYRTDEVIKEETGVLTKEVVDNDEKIENFSSLEENLISLKENSVKNAVFKNSKFSCEINNPKNELGMLCIPIIFSENWKATIDGKETKMININGGLIGIEIAEGKHFIELQYTPKFLYIGIFVSLVSLFFFIVCSIRIFRIRNNNK